MLPGVITPPMPLSISAESASLTNPQLSVADSPGWMVVGDAVKLAMLGVPEQAEVTLTVTCAVAVSDPHTAVSV
jgi:hypothetical protein